MLPLIVALTEFSRQHESTVEPTTSVSIIIATSSRTEALTETLRSLAATRVPEGWSVELLVVENVVRGGVRELLRNFPAERIAARYLFEPMRGKSRALNLALRCALGETLLFTDDDIRFPVDWIEPMCGPIVTGRADAVAGGVRLASHLLRPWMKRTHCALLASTADYLVSDHPSEMCGANMAISRRAFDAVGGFDVELGPGINGGSEESLLSWQIRRANLKLVGALDVQVEHHLAPERLQYKHWIDTAYKQGQQRAYLLYHWHHQVIRFPRLSRWYYRTKLAGRRLLSGRHKPEDEGISPWELSYAESVSKCEHYQRERRRPRKYPAPSSHLRGNLSGSWCHH